MTERDDAKFTELFEVIRAYSSRGYYYQDKALQIIAGTYVFMFEDEEMPDVRPIVDDILGQYDYVFTTLERGNLDPLSVDAVVRVALYEDEYMEWGINRLGRILESLHRRSRADESYARLRRGRGGRDPWPGEHRGRFGPRGDRRGRRGGERSLTKDSYRPTGQRTSSSAGERDLLLREDPTCGKQGGSRTAPTCAIGASPRPRPRA